MLAVNPPIGQALAGDALQRQGSAVHVVVTQSGAGVVAEIELGHVALHVLFTNMVEGADQTALEDGEEAFHGVCGHGAARVFLLGVVHALMRGVALA